MCRKFYIVNIKSNVALLNLAYVINLNPLYKIVLTKSLFQLPLSDHEDVTLNNPESHRTEFTEKEFIL